MAIQFHRDLDFAYGEPAELSPLIRRVICRNPSSFTFHGTGTYIVGRGKVAIIDPGPDEPEHVAALLNAIRGETVSHILVTHTHGDHSPASAALQAATGAPTYGFGAHPTRPDERPDQGGDHLFKPDVVLGDGDVVTGSGWTVEALHTPGHISNHLCFALAEEQALFSGDHVMGWSTSVISPPDGNMADYFASLRKLLPRAERLYLPTHGPGVPDPVPFVRDFIAHREDRERQIGAVLSTGPATIPEMVKSMYRDVPVHLHPAAARSVLAHLIHMVETGRAACDGPPGPASVFRLK